MNIKKLIAKYPDIEVEDLFSYFPRIPLPDYPMLQEYSWQECHEGFMGAGGLFLVSEMAEK